jgi:hypothetical protein
MSRTARGSSAQVSDFRQPEGRSPLRPQLGVAGGCGCEEAGQFGGYRVELRRRKISWTVSWSAPLSWALASSVTLDTGISTPDSWDLRAVGAQNTWRALA